MAKIKTIGILTSGGDAKVLWLRLKQLEFSPQEVMLQA